MNPQELANQLRKPTGEKGAEVAAFMHKGNAHFYEILPTLLPKDFSGKVLEVGFGGGDHIADFLNQFPNAHYQGLDYSADMVNAARQKHPELTFHLGDVSTEFFGQSFDVIFAINVVYFIEDLVKVFSRFKGALKAGGEVVIGKRNSADLKALNSVTQFGFIKYSHKEVQEALKKAGFTNIEIIRSEDHPVQIGSETLALHSDFIVAR